MGSLGPSELLIIFLIVLLLFGSKKLPELARGLGRGIREFQKASREIQDEITRAEYDSRRSNHHGDENYSPDSYEDTGETEDSS